MEAARYLVELERPAAGWGDVSARAEAAKAGAASMRSEGVPVRFLRSVFVPEDDACFLLFEALSAGAVSEALRRAAIKAGCVSPVLREELAR
jgi:hypothetical protein